jgi:drug/metabolite transporter (DMT)-like permease
LAGEILAILANLTFALSNVIFRKVDRQISPTYINTFRTSFGLITFYLIAAFSGLIPKIFLLSAQLWLLLLSSIIFGQVLGDTFYFFAQQILGPTNAMAVAMTFPFFTFILAILFLDRQFSILLVPAAFLITIGVILLRKAQDHNQNSSQIKRSKVFYGFLWGLFASLFWAIGIILTDYSMNQVDYYLNSGSQTTIIGNLIRFPLAVGILFVWSYWDGKRNPESKIKKSSLTWFWLILGALIGTSLGAYLYAEAARVAGASLMALMASACPLFSVPLSYLFNKEKINILGIISVVFITSGILLVIL